MVDATPGTSKPEEFGSHQKGQSDVPEENNRRPGHDGQPSPSTGPGGSGKAKPDQSPDKKDVEPGSDADADDASLGV